MEIVGMQDREVKLLLPECGQAQEDEEKNTREAAYHSGRFGMWREVPCLIII